MTEQQEQKMKLVPFTIESLQTQTNEIPWGIKQIQAPEIWETGEKGSGIVVAILDTGIDMEHPDLKDQIIDGRNFTDEGSSSDYSDGNGHGTHVAGTIAACENGSGVVGVAPEAKLLIGKVLDSGGSGSYEAIRKGIQWATDWRGKNGERVRVINMSLGGSYNDPRQYKAILKACAAGIVVCVASGNEGDNRQDTFEYGYPALYNEVITVAACDENKKLAYFSNTHLQVDIIGAGVKVMSTYPKSQYAALSGTSMATPHIAGALALVIAVGEKQFKRTLTESEIFALLAKCSCSLGYEKSSEGNGLPELTRLFEECQ
jgi:major intracellular serine protease